jgi:hypothetical protein
LKERNERKNKKQQRRKKIRKEKERQKYPTIHAKSLATEE